MTNSNRWSLLLVALACVALGACGGGGGGGGSGPEAAFLTADPRGMTTGGNGGGGEVGGVAAPGATEADASGSLAREIQEADLYRVDGDRLYLLNAYRGLVVVDLATVTVVGRLPMSGFPNEMYLQGGRALVLLSAFDGLASLVDVSLANPAAPVETARFPLGGSYRASRLVGDVLYAVTDGAVRSFVVGASVSPAGTAPLANGVSFVHATDAWLAVSGWGDWDGTSPVTLVDISDPAGLVAVRGTIDLQGWIADEQKMSIAGGVLRVVTHDWVDGGLSRLYTVGLSDPDAPTVLATLSLARGEQLFATRFTDDAAYVVTFEQVDPLWVIDLRDPSAPAITGSLVTPGWSTHLVPAGDGRLVALGVDPADGWHVIASLFDVSDPTAPALLDRADFGWGWSSAFYDVKALGVFPAEGLVFVPFGGETDRLAVLALGATTLDLQGYVGMEGAVQRGLPHPRGLVGVSTEEVVVVDPATLADRGRSVIAENVVDACRLPDGTLLSLISKSHGGTLGDVALPLVPERLYPYGFQVAVVGWDDLGRAARVVDFAGASPVVSERFDLGGAFYWLGDPAWGLKMNATSGFWGGGGSNDAVLTADGRLVVHGLPGDVWYGGGDPGQPMPLSAAAGPGPFDGFVVIDVGGSALDAPIEIEDNYVTGFVADGGDLVYTLGGYASADGLGRPRMRHDLVRVNLETRASTTAINVPGYVVSAYGAQVFTVEESWTAGWSWEGSVVALSIDPAGVPVVLDRLVLPEGAYDLRAAGATLFFTASSYGGGPLPGPVPGGDNLPPGVAMPEWSGQGGTWLPTTTLGTVHLGAALSLGAGISDDQHFLTLLLPEDGSCLVVRDGTTVDRWDVSGLSAALSWSLDVGAYPYVARPDEPAGAYLLALGFGGLATAP